MGNYRPVSLTSVVGESVTMNYQRRNIRTFGKAKHYPSESACFMKGKSCLTNLLEFFEDVTSKVDNGDPVDVVYLGFRKAFDKVPHKRLIHKVRSHRIRGNLLAWIGDG